MKNPTEENFDMLFRNMIVYAIVCRAQAEGKIIGAYHISLFDSQALSNWLNKYHSEKMVSLSALGKKIEELAKRVPLSGGPRIQ